MTKKLKLALLCGGPSPERGISLNSARSVCDHLQSEVVEIMPLYFDFHRKPYRISRAELYCNTPSDFDFKLKQNTKPLSASGLKTFLKSADIVFPVIHGAYGEDGEIQKLLESLKVPYVGSPVNACKKAFDKFEANEFIREHGFYAPPSMDLKIHHTNHLKRLRSFFSEYKIRRAVIKPATGGSSIGVHSVSTPEEALEKGKSLFGKRLDTRLVVESFCQGTEFTVIILQNRFGLPVAILPTEIELSYDHHQIFDYRKKYLATRQVRYHCPPRFNDEIIERIQIQAEQLFTLFGMRDFARFDGWVFPDGNIWFSDFNPISGMEQNSFLFMQAAQIGMSHRDLLRYVIKHACQRYGLDFPTENPLPVSRKKVHVLFGGSTAERQVSLMSGTNVWLKLRRSKKYAPEPFLLDTKGHVWKLPYAMTLNHTVEEIEEMCEGALKNEKRLQDLKRRVYEKLNLVKDTATEVHFIPEKMSLETFVKKSPYVFIGLHGGIGENGQLQAMLEKNKIPFNGSDSVASRLGMDKFETGKALGGLQGEGILSAPKKPVKLSDLVKKTSPDLSRYWKFLQKELESKSLIVKPIGEGCSAGIARLFTVGDLVKYLKYALNQAAYIPEGTLKEQHGIIEMPPVPMKELLFEKYIITDRVRVIQDQLKWATRNNWIEITMGLIEQKGRLKALNPSVTVATGNVLSLEEKFQGGTGINITPPPSPFVKPSAITKARQRMEKVGTVLGVSNYARIDAFMHIKTGELMIIETNTLPGLTPSTVIYHQALAEEKPLYPTEFLEEIISARY